MEPIFKNKKFANSLWVIIIPLAIFCFLGAFVAIERAGIILDEEAASPGQLSLMPKEYLVPRSEHNNDVRCLVLYDSMEEYSPDSLENITFVLDQMSVGFTLVDLGIEPDLPRLSGYKTIVIACSEMPAPLFLSLDVLIDWVLSGGGLLFALTPEDEVLYTIFNRLLGVERGNYTNVPQVTAILETDFLAGGKGLKVEWSEEGDPEDYRNGLNFVLDSSSTLHMSSTGPEGPTPLLWEHPYGRGRVVVNNNDAVFEKWSRGFFAAAYSLTEPAVAYPVINASVFFIDDFPSPVPEGYSPYIRRDFGLMTEYFFVHVWYPDMIRMAKDHKIKYSGVLVETYDDNVEPPFEPEPLFVTERMKYFGTLFLNEGYEMGMHGYNHQSLVLEDFDYEDKLDYNQWPETENMKEALTELVRYQKELFPARPMRTYVPPSNVLSKEGRAVIRENFPDINLISGLLIDDEFGLDDEFGVADDGLINFPRITSGFYPFDDPEDVTAQWIMLCELNLHYVFSHFIHPDDPMDPDRGAERGWRSLSKSFDEFLTWLNQYPIRHMTAQEAGAATERFDSLTVHTTLSADEIALDLDGFYDEAWIMVRINDGTPSSIRNGSLTKLSDTLYLVKADSSQVSISLEAKG